MKRLVILVYKNGSTIGYIKSISLKNNSYTITKSLKTAKKYNAIGLCQYDIDKLTAIESSKNGEIDTVFIYSFE